MRGIFVTGTGTGVGKTHIAKAVLRCLRQQGINAAPMKPFQTGAVRKDETLSAPDLEEALHSAGMQVDPPQKRLLSPFVYEPACSPHLAARLAGEPEPQPGEASLAERAMEMVESLSEHFDFLVVEGAGGVLVPLSERESMRDLMSALGFPVLVVAQAGLGTLNHTLLTLEALRRVDIHVLGVVLNEVEEGSPEFIVEDNLDYLRRSAGVRVFGMVKFGDEASSIADSICDALLEEA